MSDEQKASALSTAAQCEGPSDTEMLDWLGVNGSYDTAPSDVGEGCIVWSGPANKYFSAPTIREAIRKAMGK